MPPLKGNISCDSGVHTFVCESTAAPWLTRTSATLTLSSWAARWRGVSPLCKSETTSDHLQRRHRTTKMQIRLPVRLWNTRLNLKELHISLCKVLCNRTLDLQERTIQKPGRWCFLKTRNIPPCSVTCGIANESSLRKSHIVFFTS